MRSIDLENTSAVEGCIVVSYQFGRNLAETKEDEKMFVKKTYKNLFMALCMVAALGFAGCATLSKEDRALLESARQSAEEAKASAARAEAVGARLEEKAGRLEEMGVRLEKAAADAEQSATRAEQAAARAEAAAEKAERIFDKSLKK
jgi:methyl-accepting chemotaxis protein